jgi:hypothetical protein
MDFRQDMSVNKTRRLCAFFVTQNSFLLEAISPCGAGVHAWRMIGYQ